MAAEKERAIGESVNSSDIQSKNDMGKRSYDQPVLEPLCFPEHNSKANFSIPLFCLLCDKMFKDVGMIKSDALLHHLLVEHQFVVADVDLIADFKSYIHYWKRRFRESSITDFCSVININSRAEDIGPKLQYNLLCDGLPEDKQLREQLQINKLQGILQHQQQERTDNHFSRNCLFCNAHFEGNRSLLFQHMVDNHAFNVGLPDNLVYVNDLLDKLEEMLNNLQCLFCEKTFKDRPTLKDHMRKKQHKKINPKNKEFDKYYLINYLEVGKNWHDILDEDDTEIRQKSRDESWEDWQEESIPIHCLFCEVTSPVTQDILSHMKECHSFDLLKIKKNQGLNFYEEVKIVNYIRRQVYNCKCIFCKEKFNSKEALLGHLNEMCHFELPDRSKSWNQPQYFFPTFENDGLLCGLPDDDDEDDDYCEDTVCENDGGTICDENHSHCGNIRSNSETDDNVNGNNEKDHHDDGNDGSDGSEIVDHGFVGNNKQPDNSCGSSECGGDGKHGRKAENSAKNENNFPTVLVNNDDVNICTKDNDEGGNCGSNGGTVCEHDMVGDNRQADNKYGSNDYGDDGKHRKAEHDTKSELDNENNDSPAALVNSNDGGVENNMDYHGNDIQNKNPGKTDGDN